MPTGEAITRYLRWLPHQRTHRPAHRTTNRARLHLHRPQGLHWITVLAGLDHPTGRDRLQHHSHWGTPAIFNARRAAVASALTYLHTQQRITEGLSGNRLI
ncbi:hypothetical protein [Rhodococcus tibetensis]|uniref:Transposase n=1 Tax=Rhodococcus tibetensis TaxID=2965064 RepID=A0ABT1QK78_9NOCA|nr:hypothetical protein [Rhodococcus sp. FXJ9.536]MCQ4122708.1 hypothetical protein [Rhodococcus sp. FXJ9.536]